MFVHVLAVVRHANPLSISTASERFVKELLSGLILGPAAVIIQMYSGLAGLHFLR